MVNKILFTAIALLPFTAPHWEVVHAASATGLYAQADKIEVKGMVLDEKGEPLIGVSIGVKGTSEGTITDMDGKFSLSVAPNALLHISYIGYKTVDIKAKADLRVVLKEDKQVLDEVVVVGYGVAKKSDLTGSVGNVSSDRIVERQVVNPVDALSGKIAGVVVNNNSGRPGGKMSVIVRGLGSINATNDPLYVIDGVVGADISLINPNDIESMNVLKDASSTAIYGARGAGGVVLITTKKGYFKTGVDVSYNMSLGVSKMARKLDVLNSSEFMTYMNAAFEADGFEPVDWHRANPHLFDENQNPIYDTDWQDAATRTAFSHRHYLTVNAGSERSRTTVSLGYQNEQGIMLENFYTRFNAKIANDTKINDRVSLSTSLTYNYTEENQLDDFNVGWYTPNRTMLEMYPVIPVYHEDGSYGTYGDFWYPAAKKENGEYVLNEKGQKVLDYNNLTQFYVSADGPVEVAEHMDRRHTNSHLLGNADLSIKIIDGLTFKSNVAVEVKMARDRYYSGKDLIEYSPSGPVASIGMTHYVYWQSENFLTYDKTWNKHHLNLMGGASWNGAYSEKLEGSGTGFSSDFYKWNNLGMAEKPGIPGSEFDEWRMNSYYARANYSYDSKYLATVTARVDGSSVFGENHRYAFFPSAALAWVVNREEFLKDVDFLSNLKLRFSAGQTGNAGIDHYTTLATLGSTNVVFGDKNYLKGMVQSGMPNPELKWETTTQYDLGLDLGFFDNRIMTSLELYWRNTTDLLLWKPVSYVTGYGSVMDNIGQVKNHGFEFTLNTHNIKSRDFNWMSTFLLSTNRNEVVKLTDDNADIWNGGFVGINYNLIRKGEALSTIYGLKRAGTGTWGTDEAEEAARYGKKPGDKKYVDRNNDGKIDYDNDGFVLGNLYPDFEINFSNTFTYKNFDLSLDIQGKFGNKGINLARMTAEQRGWYGNSFSAIMNYWTPENQNTMIERPRTCIGDNPQEIQIDDNLIEDASYVRFKNLMIGYTLPDKLAARMHLKKLRIYANIENFALITDYSGYDPETTNMSGQGVEFFSYPKPMNFNFGLNVTF